MDLYYFFQKYLNKKNDVEFGITWEKLVQTRIKMFIGVVFLIWVLLSALSGYLLSLLVGMFFGIVLMFFFGAYLAYIIFVQTLRFLASNNARYVQSKMDIDNNVMNYEDVVE